MSIAYCTSYPLTVVSGNQVMISFNGFWFTIRSPLTAFGADALVEVSEEASCVPEEADGFFVADGVLEEDGFFVAAGALEAARVLEVPGLLEAAGVLEVSGLLDAAGVSDAVPFFGMTSPCCRTFLQTLQMVSPVYPSSVVVAGFLFTTSFSQ